MLNDIHPYSSARRQTEDNYNKVINPYYRVYSASLLHTYHQKDFTDAWLFLQHWLISHSFDRHPNTEAIPAIPGHTCREACCVSGRVAYQPYPLRST